MAQTTQSISNTLFEKAKSQYAISSSIGLRQEEPEKEDRLSMMYSLYDSVFNLYITLQKAHHVLEMKMIELQSRLKEEEKQK